MEAYSELMGKAQSAIFDASTYLEKRDLLDDLKSKLSQTFLPGSGNIEKRIGKLIMKYGLKLYASCPVCGHEDTVVQHLTYDGEEVRCFGHKTNTYEWIFNWHDYRESQADRTQYHDLGGKTYNTDYLALISKRLDTGPLGINTITKLLAVRHTDWTRRQIRTEISTLIRLLPKNTPVTSNTIGNGVRVGFMEFAHPEAYGDRQITDLYHTFTFLRERDALFI